MTTVLVTGATGRTGRHLVDGLLAEGADVRALVRDPRIAELPDRVTVVEGSLEDPAAVDAAARGAVAAFLLWPGFTGPDVLTQREQVAAIGAAIGRELRVEEQSPSEAHRHFAEAMGEDYADAAWSHWATLVERPERATADVERVSGHRARSYASWARDHAEVFAGGSPRPRDPDPRSS